MREYFYNDADDGKLSANINIGWFFFVLWGARKTILATTVAFFVLGLIWSRSFQPDYTSAVILMPAESDVSQIGTLGSMSGLLSVQADLPLSHFKAFEIALNSAGVADLLYKRGVVCRVMPGCDPRTGKWLPKTGVMAFVSNIAHQVLNLPPAANRPTILQITSFVKREVFVDKKRDGTLILTYKNKDPELGTEFLCDLVRITNEYIKQKDSVTLKTYVNYLSHKIDSLAVLSQREPLETILTDQTRKLMLTQVDAPYAASTLDVPAPVRGSPINGILVFGAVGFVFSIVWASLSIRLKDAILRVICIWRYFSHGNRYE